MQENLFFFSRKLVSDKDEVYYQNVETGDVVWAIPKDGKWSEHQHKKKNTPHGWTLLQMMDILKEKKKTWSMMILIICFYFSAKNPSHLCQQFEIDIID